MKAVSDGSSELMMLSSLNNFVLFLQKKGFFFLILFMYNISAQSHIFPLICYRLAKNDPRSECQILLNYTMCIRPIMLLDNMYDYSTSTVIIVIEVQDNLRNWRLMTKEGEMYICGSRSIVTQSVSLQQLHKSQNTKQ